MNFLTKLHAVNVGPALTRGAAILREIAMLAENAMLCNRMSDRVCGVAGQEVA